MDAAPLTPPNAFRLREPLSWILYDVANTVYAATITFLFAAYVSDRFHMTSAIGATQTVSMIVAGLCVPLVAAIADRTGHAKAYLVVLTMACVAASATFGLDAPQFIIMLAFGCANFCYNMALVFYNALLPSVCSPQRAGLVSGLGVGFGYMGTLLTVALLLPLADVVGMPVTFGLAALLFLLLALPCFFFVKERRAMKRERFTLALVRERVIHLQRTFKGLRNDRQMRNFLIGNFLCVDVVNTAILVFALYSLSVFSGHQVELFGMHFDLRLAVESGKDEVLRPDGKAFIMWLGIALNLCALVAGVLLGLMADRLGALQTMRFSAICLVLAVAGAFVFAGKGIRNTEVKTITELARHQASEQQWQSTLAEHELASVAPSQELIQEQQEYAKLREASGVKAQSMLMPDRVIAQTHAESVSANGYALSLIVAGAIGLAGVWTAGRKVLIQLAPPERLGEYFGLYGITTKLSVIGSLGFTVIMDIAGSHWAMLALLPPMGLGIFFLWRVRAR